jgi:hypothetical protein
MVRKEMRKKEKKREREEQIPRFVSASAHYHRTQRLANGVL